MNIGEKVMLHLHRSVKKGDLFRVIKVNGSHVTFAAIDHDCLRPDEKGLIKKATGRRPGRKPSRYGIKGVPRPAPFVPKKTLLECLDTIDKEAEE